MADITKNFLKAFGTNNYADFMVRLVLFHFYPIFCAGLIGTSIVYDSFLLPLVLGASGIGVALICSYLDKLGSKWHV